MSPQSLAEYYAKIEIKGNKYFENLISAQAWASRKKWSEVGKPVDIGQWYMTPQTVNAYYVSKDICICMNFIGKVVTWFFLLQFRILLLMKSYFQLVIILLKMFQFIVHIYLFTLFINNRNTSITVFQC
jgi:hypothetical protein